MYIPIKFPTFFMFKKKRKKKILPVKVFKYRSTLKKNEPFKKKCNYIDKP